MNKRLERLMRPGMSWLLAVLVVFCLLALVMEYFLLAAIEAVITVLIVVIYIVWQNHRKKEIHAFIQSTFSTLDETKGAESPFPMVLFRLVDGGIFWTNDRFVTMSGYREKLHEQRIRDILPDCPTDWLAEGKSECPRDVTVGQRRYRVYGTAVRTGQSGNTVVGMMYFSDVTELYQVRDEYIRSRPVVSIILVDNYEELTMNLSESAISKMNAEINDAITSWAEGYHGLLRKLERNRYLLVFEKRHLDDAKKEKFSLLEDIHQVCNPTGLEASISFGLGVDGATFEESYNFAALSIEMALSRGGDQAVIKDRMNFEFYGGRAREADNRSKVRSRTNAGTLMELMGQSNTVFVMGHKNADMDAVGAALGICCMARKKGKKAYIVLDRENNASQRLIAEIDQVPEYRDTIISGSDALLLCDNRSILVVVDTNRPDQVEYAPLLEAIPKVSIVDHHRRAVDYIEVTGVNMHEPAASSASELVTELLQYAVEARDILPIEVKGLLAGIVLDTKNFNVRTGERTFEAASVLRRMGADTVEVKRLLQSDFQSTMEKYQIMKAARLYRQEIAIAPLSTATTRPLAAQAADELLNISGIAASFVLYPQDEGVIISARSIGTANVQMILEPLGGGGNTATAGAQLKNCTVKDALDQLIRSIDQYYAEE